MIKDGVAVAEIAGSHWNANQLRWIADRLDRETSEYKASQYPKLRPLTRDEWIERREWWVRKKDEPLVASAIAVIGPQGIESGLDQFTFEEALEDAEMSRDCIHWQACGVPE